MMRWSLLFIVAAVLFVSPSLADVVVLNDSNFEHETQASTGQTTGKWFVKFYASWCGHCKNLAPVWDELSESVGEEENNDVIVAKVDAVANRDTAKRFGVRGYPTLLYFANGSMYRYEGPRKLEDMRDFCVEGYKTAEGMPVPAPPSWMEIQRRNFQKWVDSNEHLSMLMEDFEHILDIRKNAAVVLLLMGATVGFVAGYVVASMRGTKKEPTKSKTA